MTSPENNDLALFRERIARLEERGVAAEKALDLAREAMENWKVQSNGAHKQIQDERIAFCPIAKADAIETRVLALEKLNERDLGEKSHEDKTWAYVVSGLGIMFGTIELIIRWPK